MANIEAPVALFVYNRLSHTKKTLTALAKNHGAASTALTIFCDGPKENSSNKDILEVRAFVKGIQGFKSVEVIESIENKGLAKSIIDGVSHMMANYGHAIVIEDDLVTSPYFLRFMNEGLEKYRADDRVISIHGYVYPTKRTLPETFFIRGADCWGWATWSRGWQLFEANGEKLLAELQRRKLIKNFDFNNSYGYTEMLKKQIAGKTSSWAIRWNASAFIAGRLTLYPGMSLVENIGTDGSGTNCDPSNEFHVELSNEHIHLTDIPVEDNKAARSAFEEYFLSLRPSLWSRIKNKLTAFPLKRI